jgi:hypothetical protein
MGPEHDERAVRPCAPHWMWLPGAFARWLACAPDLADQARLLHHLVGDDPGTAARLEGFLEAELARMSAVGAVVGARSVG